MKRGLRGSPSVLIVEDDADIARMLVLMLEMHGHEAHVVPTGEAVLDHLCRKGHNVGPRAARNRPPPPGLLLLDLQLADMDRLMSSVAKALS